MTKLPERKKLPARKKPVTSPPQNTGEPAAKSASLPERKLPARTKKQPQTTEKQTPAKQPAEPAAGTALPSRSSVKKVVESETSRHVAVADTNLPERKPSQAIEVIDTIPWPDWTTPERNAIRSLELGEYASRTPHRPWWERHDLWWSDELFGNGNPTWRTPGSYVWTNTVSVTGQPARRRVRVPEFHGQPSIRSPHARNVISTLLMWHHATSRQLAAMCGHHPTNFSGRILKPLYESGVVERGRFSATTENSLKHDYCYRLRIDEPLWRWLDRFDDDTWTNITYGVVPTEPRNHVRHNLMAFEIGLRIMETVPNITSVYGERVTSMRKLLGTNNKQHGDIGVVRSDGLRVVIELVHEQYREGFSNKIASWGRALTARGTVADHGTVVVFVVAPRAFNESIGEIRRRFRDALTPQGLTDPASGVAADPNKVANARLHIFLAAWPDWFPGPHAISTEFLRLSGWRLNAQDQWIAVDVADPDSVNGFPFTPKNPSLWGMPQSLTGQLYAQPEWAGKPKNTLRIEEEPYVKPAFPTKKKTRK